MWAGPILGFAYGLTGMMILGFHGAYLVPGAGLAWYYFSRDDNFVVTLGAAALGTVAGLILLAALPDVSPAADFRLAP